MSGSNIQAVYDYWNGNPLGSLESPHEVGTREFFDWHHRVRDYDEGEFTYPMYEFDKQKGKKVLDIGCGNGWLVWNFAKNGADITGVDLTDKAVALTKQRVAAYGLSANVQVGNAENLPFADQTFDYVTSAGVLHHTPDTEKSISEAVRVLKVGGRGMISLYYRHPLLSPLLWPATKMFVHILFKAVPGRSQFMTVETPNDLVRLYDGNDNPIGKAYNHVDIRKMMPNCTFEKFEIHYFPTRFLLAEKAPLFVRKFMDRVFGLMIYVKFEKKSHDACP